MSAWCSWVLAGLALESWERSQWSHRPSEAACAVLKPVSRALGMAAEASMVEGPPYPPRLCRDHRTARTAGAFHLLTKQPGHRTQQQRLDWG